MWASYINAKRISKHAAYAILNERYLVLSIDRPTWRSKSPLDAPNYSTIASHKNIFAFIGRAKGKYVPYPSQIISHGNMFSVYKISPLIALPTYMESQKSSLGFFNNQKAHKCLSCQVKMAIFGDPQQEISGLWQSGCLVFIYTDRHQNTFYIVCSFFWYYF